jgi:AcrR family transcriptional regulator
MSPMPDSAPTTARARARAELTAEITATARRHLSEKGPGELSLRAVARELGMVSSALYRYFPSRDALLTQLIIEAYNALGQACEDAEASQRRTDLIGRWRAICHAARDWGLANPHEYALIYGSPVPGYAAPDATIDSASRILVLLVDLMVDIDASGTAAPSSVPMPRPLGTQLSAMRAENNIPVDNQRLMSGISAWTLLFGLINFEVFGRFNGMFEPANLVFDHQIDRAALAAGIPLKGR